MHRINACIEENFFCKNSEFCRKNFRIKKHNFSFGNFFLNKKIQNIPQFYVQFIFCKCTTKSRSYSALNFC